MPRQPYLPTFAHLRYSVGALVLRERPDLCAAIGKCIAIWSQVENEMGNLLGILLGTESEAALEVFLSLRRSSSQREALVAAAKHKLKDEALDAFRALIAVYKSLEAQRNALAHGCFGVCPDDATILFWIHLTDHVHFQTEVLTKESKGVFDEDRHAHLKKRLFVYRTTDLEALYQDMEEFWYAGFYFNGYLREPQNTYRQGDFTKLRALPQIARALNTGV